jgi:hypothetical protein
MESLIELGTKPATLRKRKRVWNLWCDFCSQRSLNVFAPTQALVNGFAYHLLAAHGLSPGRGSTAMAYVNTFLLICKVKTIDVSAINTVGITKMVEAAAIVASEASLKPLPKKFPIQPHHFVLLLEKVLPPTSDFSSKVMFECLSLLAAGRLALALSLRLVHVAAYNSDSIKTLLLRSDVSVHRDSVTLLITQTKTSTSAESRHLESKPAKELLLRYLQVRDKLFPPVAPLPLFLNAEGSHFSLDSLQNRYRDWLRHYVPEFNASNCSSVSFRAGAATALSSNGFNLKTVKRIGRWKGSSVKRYIRKDLLPPPPPTSESAITTKALTSI